MGNMAYCRFRNTVEDLLDCEEHLDEVLSQYEPEHAERQAAEKLIKLCQQIASDYGE